MLSSVLIVIGGLSVGFLFRNWSLPEVADRTTPFFRAGCHPSRHPSEEKVVHNGPLLRRVTDPFSKRPVVDNFQERRRDRSIPEHSQNISRELGNRPHIWRKRLFFKSHQASGGKRYWIWDRLYLTISLACEELGPPEYLDFLDKILDIHEQKKVRGETIGYADLLFFGQGRKKSFLAVNWENPRVRGILLRAVRLFSDLDPDAANYLQRQANGELADNYMTGEPDDAPRPETLPGVKLQRPWASLIRKYEQLTAKKVPYDPTFDPRPSKRPGQTAESSGTPAQIKNGHFSTWPWFAFLVALLATGLCSWKFRWSFKAASSKGR
jgi:hypothetical protein